MSTFFENPQYRYTKSEGGIYMIEDLHTSFWEQFGGGLRSEGNFFRKVSSIVEDMHHWYHGTKPSNPSLFNAVTGVHIHDSVVVFEKNQSHRPAHSRVGAS